MTTDAQGAAFTLQHSSLTEVLTFENREAVSDWTATERQFWSHFHPHGAVEGDRRTAENALGRLSDIVKRGTDDEIQSALNGLGPLRLMSMSPHGQMFQAMIADGYPPKALTSAYLVLYRPDDVRHVVQQADWLLEAIRGVGRVAALECGIDMQQLVQAQRLIDEKRTIWHQQLDAARVETSERRTEHENAVSDLRRDLKDAKNALETVKAEHQQHIDDTRKQFHEAFALSSPRVYWSNKAIRHEEDAEKYRSLFTRVLSAGLVLLSLLAVAWLFPLMEANPSSYWAVVLFSFGIAILAWPLRMLAKQYLVHQQLREDAVERSVIVETFLSLREQVELTDADRTLLLTALMRQASVPLTGDDSGSSLALSDLLAAKTVLKS